MRVRAAGGTEAGHRQTSSIGIVPPGQNATWHYLMRMRACGATGKERLELSM